MRTIILSPEALDHLNDWVKSDSKTALKILELVKEIAKTPFSGSGKPEPLKYELKGYWSRRITLEHRLIYKITETEIIINSCKYHYA